MTAFYLPSINEITEQHLQDLIDNGVSESISLEFKSQNYGSSDDEKREFLKDVTALANTTGGHLVIGMTEVDGVATGLKPITTTSADQEKQKLENMLLAAVEPRLLSPHIREVKISGGYVLVLHVLRSWNPPHRVTYKSLNRYFFRHSSGVYEPSVEQLRAVFVGGAERDRQLLEFRLDRLGRLQSGERGPRIRGSGQLVVQVVPLVERQASFGLPSVQTALQSFQPPGAGGGVDWFHNLEGLVLYSASSASGMLVEPTSAYTQLFHTGAVEFVRGGCVVDRDIGGTTSRVIGGERVLRDLFDSVRRGVAGLRSCGLAAPFVVMISLLDAAGAKLAATRSDFDEARPLDRADLLFAPVVITDENLDGDWSVRLAPVADSLWNAFGCERCDILRDARGVWSGLPSGTASGFLRMYGQAESLAPERVSHPIHLAEASAEYAGANSAKSANSLARINLVDPLIQTHYISFQGR
jgi:hypothetical protein